MAGEKSVGAPGENESGTADKMEENEETPDYAGFGSPEELTAAYKSAQDRVNELDRLRGTQGNELGELRAETARLKGMIEAFDSERERASSSKTDGVEDVQELYETGQISFAEATRRIARAEAENLSKSVDEKVKSEITRLKSEMSDAEYKRQYLRDNPGYEKAFLEGHLNEDIKNGLSGQQAYDRYLIRQKDKEIEDLKKQSSEKVKAAESKGVNDGIDLEKGKEGAASVIGSASSGLQSGVGSNVIPMTHQERKEKALETLRKMRRGGP